MGYNNIPIDIKNYLPGEFLTDDNFQPSNVNFLTGNKSIFVLSRCPNISFFCQRSNIPSVSAGVSIQNNPNAVQIQRPGTEISLEDLQIGFAVDENMSNWLEIFRWIKDISVYGTYTEILRENQKVSDAILLVLNSSSEILILATSTLNSKTGIDVAIKLPSQEKMFPLAASIVMISVFCFFSFSFQKSPSTN